MPKSLFLQKSFPLTSVLRGLKFRHLTEISWLFLSNVGQIVIGFALIKIISTIGTTEYGKYALVLSAVPLVNALIYTPIDQFCQRYYYTYLYEKRINLLTKSIFSILVRIGLALLGILVLTTLTLKFVFDFKFQTLFFWIISCIYTLVIANSIPFQSLLNTMRLRQLVAYFGVSEKFLQLVVLTGFSFIFKLDALLILSVFAIIGIVFLILKIIVVRRKLPHEQDHQQAGSTHNSQEIDRQLISFGFPLLVFGLFAWFQTYGERWVINFSLDLSSVGVYAFIVMVANTSLMIFLSAFGTFVGPITWEKFSDLRDSSKIAIGIKFIMLQVWFVVLFSASVSIGFYFFGNWIIKILGGDEFSRYSNLLPLIIAGIGLFYAAQTLNSVGFGYNRMSDYGIVKFISSIASILAYWLGVHFWGLMGVAWGSIISNALYVVLTLAVNRRIIRTQAPFIDT